VTGASFGLRRHVVAVVAALFALAVGIALGGGPLSYVPEDDTPATSDRTEPDDDGSESPDPEAAPADGGFADAFAASAAARLYNGVLLGHPTVVVAMPGVEPGLVEAMAAEVPAAGGGLTGIFEITEQTVDRDETSLVDSLGSQLMTQLGDARVDPTASTYVRLGQLLSIAVATPVKDGLRADPSAETIRASLTTAGLLTGPQDARLAPLVLVLLPTSAEQEPDDALAEAAIYAGLMAGLRVNAAGVVLLGDTASGEAGLLSELREDDLITSTIATVDGGDTAIGRVTAMLALISSLDGSVGAYGASGSDGAVPIS
jgi:Copper transport outer membrane protein, MctB